MNELAELYKTAEAVMKSQTHSTANFVPGIGPLNKYMIIGEAPGREEDKTGLPFVGQAGQLLRECLEDVGLPIDEVFITNVWKLRLAYNRTPTLTEVRIGRKFLVSEVEIVNPHTIIGLGYIANTAMWPSSGRLRGQLYDDDKRQTISTYHPGYLLDYMHPELTPIFKNHLKMAIKGGELNK